MGSNLPQVGRRWVVGGSCPWQQLPGAKQLGLDGGGSALNNYGAARAALLCFDASDATIWLRTGAKQLPAGGTPTNLGARPN